MNYMTSRSARRIAKNKIFYLDFLSNMVIFYYNEYHKFFVPRAKKFREIYLTCQDRYIQSPISRTGTAEMNLLSFLQGGDDLLFDRVIDETKINQYHEPYELKDLKDTINWIASNFEESDRKNVAIGLEKLFIFLQTIINIYHYKKFRVNFLKELYSMIKNLKEQDSYENELMKLILLMRSELHYFG